jgi:hypothetical protein
MPNTSDAQENSRLPIHASPCILRDSTVPIVLFGFPDTAQTRGQKTADLKPDPRFVASQAGIHCWTALAVAKQWREKGMVRRIQTPSHWRDPNDQFPWRAGELRTRGNLLTSNGGEL